MSGFRRALPFTFACFIIGGLALSGVPPLSGYFSKDSILLFVAGRGGWHWALWAAGYLGAFLTALYTFRMIFRAFLGEPCAEAGADRARPPLPPGGADQPRQRRDRGHRRRLPRSRPRGRRARLADARGDGALALLAIVGGTVSIPKSTFWLDHFLAPTFANSTIVSDSSQRRLAIGLILGAVVSLGGIATAYYVWVLRPGMAVEIRSRFSCSPRCSRTMVLRRADRRARRAPRAGSAASPRTASSGCW